MAKVFSRDDPADVRDCIKEALVQDLLYGNLYMTLDGRDIIIWETGDLKQVQE